MLALPALVLGAKLVAPFAGPGAAALVHLVEAAAAVAFIGWVAAWSARVVSRAWSERGPPMRVRAWLRAPAGWAVVALGHAIGGARRVGAVVAAAAVALVVLTGAQAMPGPAGSCPGPGRNARRCAVPAGVRENPSTPRREMTWDGRDVLFPYVYPPN
jgi:hypothetical protein